MTESHVRTKPAESSLTYEQALGELQSRLRRLEEDDLTLEESLQAVSEGRRYLALCNRILDDAERRIEIHAEEPSEAALAPDEFPFPGDEDRPTEIDPDDIPF